MGEEKTPNWISANSVAVWTAMASLLLASCDSDQLVSSLEPVRTDTVLVLRNAIQLVHNPPYVPQQLEHAARSEVFTRHVDRALERRRLLTGRTPTRLFEKVTAASDYVANLAKHPYRHQMGRDESDPRAKFLTGHPEQLAILAEENQGWTGEEWVPVPGKTLADIPPLECTYQHLILGGLVNSIGAQWRLVDIEGHTAFSYYDFELGKWVYIESTYNEHYRMSSSPADEYVPLSPDELHRVSLTDQAKTITAVRHTYQPQRFEPDSPYHLRPYVVDTPRGWAKMAVSQILTLWSPEGETFLLDLNRVSEDAFAVKLTTNLAVAEPSIERRISGRRGWSQAAAEDTVTIRVGTEVRYRARFGQFFSGEVIIRGERLSPPV